MLTQAIRALKLCLSSSFVNSLSHFEAEKLVLLSRKCLKILLLYSLFKKIKILSISYFTELKIVTYQNEIDRIKVENSVMPSASSPAKGNITISNIKLPIRMGVVHSDLKGKRNQIKSDCFHTSFLS